MRRLVKPLLVGAGGSGDQLAAKVAEIDIYAVTERVTSEQCAARSAPFEGKAAGVKKKGKGKKKSGDQRRMERNRK